MTWALLILATLWAITFFYLRGANLSRYDAPAGQHFTGGPEASDEHDAVVASLEVGMGPLQRAPRRQRLDMMRKYMDDMGEGKDLPATITPVNAGGIEAEWVVAPGADVSRRVLYIHGGAFEMGSPKSHRNITNRFSEVARAAVLVIDYRLMPENPRMAGIEDCRIAYQWMLHNGPDGPGAPSKVYVGGDSAGGNLTLSLIAWVRDQQLRRPDAAVALSPATDSTFGSPSLKNNMETDVMLGPVFKQLSRVPVALLWWFVWLKMRMSPRNPLLSPVYGNLADLPPTLVHASTAELLFDDAKRYVNRAAAAGSPARLQGWDHMVHVWHMFYPQLTEAREAWDEIGKFLAEQD